MIRIINFEYRRRTKSYGIDRNQIFAFFHTVDGNWNTWEGFGRCSVTCGGGNMIRTRVCNNPPPMNGGNSCQGSDREARECGIESCAGNIFVHTV